MSRARHRHVALIIEDEPDMASELRDLVGSLGHESQVAERLDQASAHVERGGFCYVLLDLQIPFHERSTKPSPDAGVAALERVRDVYPARAAGDKHWHGLPLIVVSGHAKEHDDVCRAFKLGADDFARKPLSVNVPTLGEKIREGLGRSGREEHALCAEVTRRSRATSEIVAPDARTTTRNPAMLHEGVLIAVTYCGTTARLPELEGVLDLGILFAKEREMIPAEALYERPLAGVDIDRDRFTRDDESIAELQVVSASDTDPIIDETMLIQARNHAAEQRARGDIDGIEKAEEIERLLSLGMDRSHKSLRFASRRTRARVAVQRRIRRALGYVEKALPELYQHLGGEAIFAKKKTRPTVLLTGTYCSYRPPEPMNWVVRLNH